MSKPFDMELFLRGVLTGSHATRQRHLRQANAIQAAISSRWHRENPWTWQQKHLVWFLNHHVNQYAESTRYYYLLTMRLLTHRLGKPWQFLRSVRVSNRPILLKKSVSLFMTEKYASEIEIRVLSRGCRAQISRSSVQK